MYIALSNRGMNQTDELGDNSERSCTRLRCPMLLTWSGVSYHAYVALDVVFVSAVVVGAHSW